MNGAQAMVKCLEAEGISRIFGYPGVAIAPFYDALYDSRRIEHILSRQEQNAGHEASGYARISRKAAVCGYCYVFTAYSKRCSGIYDAEKVVFTRSGRRLL